MGERSKEGLEKVTLKNLKCQIERGEVQWKEEEGLPQSHELFSRP